MTKLGWPVAQPRFIRRPSASTMIVCPSGKTQVWTCGLTSVFTIPGSFARPAMSISLSKWPMLQTIAWCFITAHVVGRDDVEVAGRGDEDVGDADDVLERGDLEAVHGGLQRADRVDLGDDHPGALAAQRVGAALAHVAVAADDGDLAADQHVGGAVDAVDQLWRQPYLLSNFDLVTESLTLIAGNSSVPALAIS